MTNTHKAVLLAAALVFFGGGCSFGSKVEPSGVGSVKEPKQEAVTPSENNGGVVSGGAFDAGDISLCPGKSAVTVFNSSATTFSKSGPYPVKEFSNAFALEQANGDIEIYISNRVHPSAKEWFDFKNNPYGAVPFKQKGDAMVKVTLMNAGNPVGAGEYRFENGFGKGYYTSGAMIVFDGTAANTIVMNPETGKTAVFAKQDATVCGTFSISGNGDSISGSFRAPLSKF